MSAQYAIIEMAGATPQNTIVNVAVCDDPSWAAAQGWTDLSTLPAGAWIGWYQDSQGNWNAPS